MLGRSHALSGAAAFVAAAPLLDHLTNIGPLELAAGAVVTAGCALLPDLDHPSSTIARTFGLLTQYLADCVAFWSGGHRRGTHSLLFAAGVGVLAWVLSLLGPLGLLVAVTLPLGLGLRALGWTRGGALNNLGTFIVCAAAAYGIGTHVNLGWLPAAWALGCVAHLAGDAMTNSGVPIFWPSRRMYGIPQVLRMSTGGVVEKLAVAPTLTALMVGMVLLGWLPA